MPPVIIRQQPANGQPARMQSNIVPYVAGGQKGIVPGSPLENQQSWLLNFPFDSNFFLEIFANRVAGDVYIWLVGGWKVVLTVYDASTLLLNVEPVVSGA